MTTSPSTPGPSKDEEAVPPPTRASTLSNTARLARLLTGFWRRFAWLLSILPAAARKATLAAGFGALASGLALAILGACHIAWFTPPAMLIAAGAFFTFGVLGLHLDARRARDLVIEQTRTARAEVHAQRMAEIERTIYDLRKAIARGRAPKGSRRTLAALEALWTQLAGLAGALEAPARREEEPLVRRRVADGPSAARSAATLGMQASDGPGGATPVRVEDYVDHEDEARLLEESERILRSLDP